MAEGLSHVVHEAVGKFLADNDAYPVDFLGVIRYLRTSPDGEDTYNAYAYVHPPIDPFLMSGLSCALEQYAGDFMAEQLSSD